MKHLFWAMALLLCVGCGSSDSDGEPEVKIVLNYLKVYPDDIGEYDAEPKNVIAQLNKQEKYGYNTWRIPTHEELTLLKNSGFSVGNSYMTAENPRGIVLLVTDKADAATVNQERAEEKRKQEEEEKRKQEEEEKARIKKSIKDGLGRDGIYQLGYYYNRNGNKGVVIEISYGGRNGKILSLDETECSWSDAKQWCQNHGDGWRLPTKYELEAIYRNKFDINYRLERCKGIELGNGLYWSSTECDSDSAWFVFMNSGYTNYGSKNIDIYSVRAVSAF